MIRANDFFLVLSHCLNLIQISPHTKEISFKDEAIYSASLSSCLGQTVYGRVSWNPEQDLQSAYKLSIQKVYLCAGIFIKLKSWYRILLKENRWCFYCRKKPTLFQERMVIFQTMTLREIYLGKESSLDVSNQVLNSSFASLS